MRWNIEGIGKVMAVIHVFFCRFVHARWYDSLLRGNIWTVMLILCSKSLDHLASIIYPLRIRLNLLHNHFICMSNAGHISSMVPWIPVLVDPTLWSRLKDLDNCWDLHGPLIFLAFRDRDSHPLFICSFSDHWIFPVAPSSSQNFNLSHSLVYDHIPIIPII